MGILNITPDSFSDGSQYNRLEDAASRARKMIDAGVDIIDIGGESTRPGATKVSVAEEIDRVAPIIELLADFEVKLSVDTSKPQVMKAAVESGASMINDVRALQTDGALEMASQLKVPVCLMHMQGQPRTMQSSPNYQNVVSEVLDFLKDRLETCVNYGIAKELLSIDPGFGFGKTLQHNIELLSSLEQFQCLDSPVLVGISRKSMLGEITRKKVENRLASSLAVALLAMQKGARIIRVHDVEETCDIRKIYLALSNPEKLRI